MARNAGFTVIELMVAVAVFAILAALAVPSFREYSAAQRLRAASFDLRTDLVLARSEALKRNQNVSIRPRQVAGWHTGWVVAVDSSGERLRTHNGVGAGVSVDCPADEITFNGGGRIAAPGGTVQIDLAVAAGAMHMQRCLVLDPGGMPSSRAEACS